MSALIERARRLSPATILEAFVASNLAFLAVDITLAHAENDFARSEEWLPIVFSVVVTLLLLPGVLSARFRASSVPLAIGVGAACIVVGLAGMILHLESAFFRVQSLKNLVYTAPFAAPLAYVGLGLLLLLSRVEKAGTEQWAGWVVFLALGGFAGNLALTLLDHAQNGFYRGVEWVSVAGAAFGTSFLAMALLLPSARIVRATLGVMAAQIVIGVLGFVLHLSADLHGRGSLAERLIHGAPVFAPLLFVDLALLAAIGLFPMLRMPEAPSESQGHAEPRKA